MTGSHEVRGSNPLRSIRRIKQLGRHRAAFLVFGLSALLFSGEPLSILPPCGDIFHNLTHYWVNHWRKYGPYELRCLQFFFWTVKTTSPEPVLPEASFTRRTTT